jgi:hypothetical protein
MKRPCDNFFFHPVKCREQTSNETSFVGGNLLRRRELKREIESFEFQVRSWGMGILVDEVAIGQAFSEYFDLPC